MCFTFQSQKQVVYNIPSHSAYLIFKKTGNGSVRNACYLSRGEDNNNNYDNDPIGLIVRLKYPKALANEASSTKLRNPRRLFRARENIKRASQSELKLKTREMFKARENASGQDATCSSFEFDWLRRWHDFFWTNYTAM